MSVRSWRPVLLTALACATIAQIAQAQSSAGSIHGRVRTQSGKTIAGANVLLRHLAAGQTYTQDSDATGQFRFTSVPEGEYEIVVVASGMKPMNGTRVNVAPGQPTETVIRMDQDNASAVVSVVAAEDTVAARTAPSQGSLTARSAQSDVRDEFVRNFTAPVVDYTQVVQMAPGMFSYSPNGPGLGDTKSFFRGFSDGDYTITFDGIPFQDTNSPTHHSWAFFPGQFLGGANIDRSPGSAATLGPTNFGGSINLLSRILEPDQRISAEGSFGTWNTSLYSLEYETGTLGRSNLMVNAHEMKSDGYQTFNKQHRDAVSAKYQFAVSENTQLTAFGSYMDLRANTPNTKGGTRAQIAQFGDNYLISGDPTQANYWGYNNYHVKSDFSYVGLYSNLGDGWKLDDKLYTYAYFNNQNYNGTTITATSGTDKLNSYRTTGNIFRLSQESGAGTLRTGLWSEIANTNRFQTPADPRTWVDAVLPNFHEKFKTTLLQPFVEYEIKITADLKLTPGVKYSSYKQDLTQFADNGKTVGNLGGAASIEHSATYTAVLPSLDLHYLVQSNWSLYAQFSTGDEIPPSNVFDVKNANVTVLPKSTRTKTFQAGSVFKSDAFTLDVDAYHITFDNAYSSTTDLAGNTTWFANGTSVSQGLEAESNLVLGGGFNLYANATFGSAKYSDSGKWIQNAPRDTESLGLYFQQGGWNAGLLGKRVGKMFNDNGAVHEAIAIDPFIIPNLFVNYTVKNLTSWLKQARFKLSVTNLTDKHSIVAVSPFAKTTSAPAPGDVLTLLPARSTSLSVGFDF
ncbi:TonB-dependent receptor [Geothrix sp. PMB-07]|uniref:TonB-dependent receptor n=1 Tax=Geothrix sp. PMB-07 TaxID=3068640 RepID=UPI0027420E89|nr:TonB-dependent receptor [Geothrix sp. PMB-07]WLT31899.1 TonB-dependent receptor [Geothrix sp. PMB-07]